MIYDLCIIGGGINGAGIARDAAGRGLKVLLLEKGDLASATSSSSSKMIHGGLRYLEFLEISLVRKSLAERETLMRIAPQIVRPLRLCIPHKNQVRPAWMVRMGLFLYDHLTRLNLLPKSETIHLSNHRFGQPLKEAGEVGFVYSDCWVDDARLVVLNAMDAKLRGADILTYCAVTGVRPQNGIWQIVTEKGDFAAKIVVNATGPYAREFLGANGLVTGETPGLRLVQGSHIVVPKLYDGDQAYLIQCPDQRVVFVFPYETDFTLIGTTETEISGSPEGAHLTDEEARYLLTVVNREFKREVPLAPSDIIWSYSGVRPLFDKDKGADARSVTRDYRLVVDEHQGSAILNVFGGKITTYRPLAEEVMEMLHPYFPDMTGDWTATSPLPFIDFSFAPDDTSLRYFMAEEWAQTLDDILWRRTKWGLHLSEDERNQLGTLFDRLKSTGAHHDKTTGD